MPASPSAPYRNAATRRRHALRVDVDAATWLLLTAMALPAIWIILTSIRNPVEVNAKPPVWIPREITFEGFKPLFGQETTATGSVPFGDYFRNSAVIAVSSTIIALAIGTLAGYAFARFHFRGRNALFLLFARLRLVDTPLGIILVYIAINIPFTVWLMDGFFREIPAELSESALIDGCSHWQAFRLINLPLALPGMAASAIFAFLAAWNEFQLASVLTRTTNSKTAPVGLFDFTGQFTIDWRGMAAMSVVMMLPAVLFVLLVQRNLVRGLTLGATKG